MIYDEHQYVLKEHKNDLQKVEMNRNELVVVVFHQIVLPFEYCYCVDQPEIDIYSNNVFVKIQLKLKAIKHKKYL